MVRQTNVAVDKRGGWRGKPFARGRGDGMRGRGGIHKHPTPLMSRPMPIPPPMRRPLMHHGRGGVRPPLMDGPRMNGPGPGPNGRSGPPNRMGPLLPLNRMGPPGMNRMGPAGGPPNRMGPPGPPNRLGPPGPNRLGPPGPPNRLGPHGPPNRMLGPPNRPRMGPGMGPRMPPSGQFNSMNKKGGNGKPGDRSPEAIKNGKPIRLRMSGPGPHGMRGHPAMRGMIPPPCPMRPPFGPGMMGPPMRGRGRGLMGRGMMRGRLSSRGKSNKPGISRTANKKVRLGSLDIFYLLL